MRAVQVGSAPAGGELVAVSLTPYVMRVMVQIACQIHYDGCAALADAVFEEVQVLVRVLLGPRCGGGGACVDPARRRGAQDQTIARLEGARKVIEVIDLLRVDIGFELNIDCPQPPAVWQLEGKVAA